MPTYSTKRKFVTEFGKKKKEEEKIQLGKKLKRYQYNTAYQDLINKDTSLDDSLLLTQQIQEHDFSPYIISKDLILAVKAALITGRPLLLRGEPGSGKTKLALAIAVAMYGDEAYKYYFEWHVKSYSKAKDGGYTFDYLERLREATGSGNKKKVDPRKYVKLGPLGMAFRKSEKDKPAILLIDEIDKSDIDFPNDLLLELDEDRIIIPEVKGVANQIIAKERPLVFITSNDERTLPPAFLRRCLYHEIKLSTALFEKIIISKLKDIQQELKEEFGLTRIKNPLTKNDAKNIVTVFSDLRDDIGNNTFSGKRSSTSELLDWVKMLQYTLSTDPNKPTLEKLLAQKFPTEEEPYNFRSLILKQKLDS